MDIGNCITGGMEICDINSYSVLSITIKYCKVALHEIGNEIIGGKKQKFDVGLTVDTPENPQ